MGRMLRFNPVEAETEEITLQLFPYIVEYDGLFIRNYNEPDP